MPSYEPTDEEIAALTRETDEEEALEERQRQARRSENKEEASFQRQRQRLQDRGPRDWCIKW
tara:strand:+ start:755 stop:940 length:186 start_codon:yes stop_codon:yes gene_type:complete